MGGFSHQRICHQQRQKQNHSTVYGNSQLFISINPSSLSQSVTLFLAVSRSFWGSRAGNAETVFHFAFCNIGNRRFRIGKPTAAVGAKRNNGLARQIISLQKIVNDHWHIAPPVGIADKKRVIIIHIVHRVSNFRAGIVCHFLSGYIQKPLIGGRIWCFRFDFK